MLDRSLLCALVLVTAACAGTGSARAFDETKYPDLKGQWTRISPPGMPAFDPGKPRGRGQEAPLTPEYQAVFEANLADIAAGGEGAWPGYTCRPPGMPAMMTAYEAMEVVIEAVHGKTDAVVRESAGLVYNLTVLWAAAGVRTQDV